MANINGTKFNDNNTANGNGKFHKFLVGTIALLPLSLIGFSLGTVITAPALARWPAWCAPEFKDCNGDGGGDLGGEDPGGGGGGDDGFDPPHEPDPKPPNQPKPKPKPPNQPKPKPPSQPKPDPSICNKKPDLPQCN